MDWTLYAWVKRGKRRYNTLKVISSSQKPLTPKQIQKEVGISLSQLSLILKELSEKNLILCLNSQDKIGKNYVISAEGEEIINAI